VRADFRALRAAAAAVWIVKVAITDTPRTVKTLLRILVSIELEEDFERIAHFQLIPITQLYSRSLRG
jgi:hypothetical protein